MTSYEDRNVTPVRDMYVALEVLASQAGAGGVLTFTFVDTTPELVWVRSEAATSYAATSQNPSNGFGVVCEDGVPQPITVRTSTVKVWAPSGATVHCWGYS